MLDLVLASTSPYRRALLARLGVPFEAVAPGVDERALSQEGLSAELLVGRLARAKAQAVATRLAASRPGALVIGSDQVAELEGEILGKPGTPEGARAQLSRLAGREHRLLTALSVVRAGDGARAEALDIHRLRLRALSEEQISRYVEAESPLDCAGSYKIEGLGIALFEWIRGDDFTGVVGLPLTRLVALLGELGAVLP
ncbi:MAG: nucleoside triphosphate pyrophosphatase [Polyangia bacterium]|jgi:septum formation protein|nr:nucleoside triphosphate pyrophosphatase [Polyangia bacterium]